MKELCNGGGSDIDRIPPGQVAELDLLQGLGGLDGWTTFSDAESLGTDLGALTASNSFDAPVVVVWLDTRREVAQDHRLGYASTGNEASTDRG